MASRSTRYYSRFWSCTKLLIFSATITLISLLVSCEEKEPELTECGREKVGEIKNEQVIFMTTFSNMFFSLERGMVAPCDGSTGWDDFRFSLESYDLVRGKPLRIDAQLEKSSILVDDGLTWAWAFISPTSIEVEETIELPEGFDYEIFEIAREAGTAYGYKIWHNGDELVWNTVPGLEGEKVFTQYLSAFNIAMLTIHKMHKYGTSEITKDDITFMSAFYE